MTKYDSKLTFGNSSLLTKLFLIVADQSGSTSTNAFNIDRYFLAYAFPLHALS